MSTATITCNGVRLRYLREGGGEPVLLVHGYLFGADWWRPQLDALSDAYDVIAVDLRGQMGSETTDGAAGYDLWNQAEDLAALIAELGIAAVHWVGLSMGGMIGMRFALGHPEGLRSLVLMDTSAAVEDPERAERYGAMRSVVAAGGLESVVDALPPIFLRDAWIAAHADAVAAWLNALRASDPNGLVLAGAAIDSRDDIRGRLAEIRVPTLVIHGDDDVPIPMERAEEIARGIPGARLEVVEAGHQSNVDCAEATSRLIREFLDSIAARPGG